MIFRGQESVIKGHDKGSLVKGQGSLVSGQGSLVSHGLVVTIRGHWPEVRVTGLWSRVTGQSQRSLVTCQWSSVIGQTIFYHQTLHQRGVQMRHSKALHTDGKTAQIRVYRFIIV